MLNSKFCPFMAGTTFLLFSLTADCGGSGGGASQDARLSSDSGVSLDSGSPTDAWISSDAPVKTDVPAPAITDVPVSTEVQSSADARATTDAPVSADVQGSADARAIADAPVSTDTEFGGGPGHNGCSVSTDTQSSADARATTDTPVSTDAKVTPDTLVSTDAKVTLDTLVSTDARVLADAQVLPDAGISLDGGNSTLLVNLGTAGNFVILAKSGISTVPTSVITGDLGISPASASYITGFSLTADATNVFSTSPQVTGKVYAADYAPPTSINLTTAVSDMGLAFTDAAGRAPDVTELGAGNVGGMTLAPGVYKWSTGLLIPTDVTLNGGATDVWIFQIAQDLTFGSAAKVLLAGGALPQERLLAGVRPCGSRHNRPLRRRHSGADINHAANRCIDQGQIVGADGGQHRRQHRGRTRSLVTRRARITVSFLIRSELIRSIWV
jgi:hypothetical protein